MKQTIIFTLLLQVIFANGQTVEIETSLLNQGIKEGRWSQEGMMERGRKWSELKHNYPLMPYDSATGQIIFDDIITFPGISKAQAFKRVKEWAVSNFGSIDAVLDYEDLESGKLFFKGYTEITHFTQVKILWETSSVPTTSNLYFTLQLTIKDEKAKVRLENLRFRNYRAGYAASTYYVPGDWEETSMGSYLPVAWKSPGTWEATFDLLRNSMKRLKSNAPSIERHIRAAGSDYRF